MAESEAAATGAAAGGRAVMSIGEVLSLLRPDFPDTTMSKLRFLESEGLVCPERAASGYRKYSADDVARLRYILTAQRDHYLPLRVIRDHLAEADRSGVSPGRWGRGRVPLVAVEDVAGSVEVADAAGRVRLSRAQVADRAGISDGLLADIEQYGLVSALPGGYFGGEALEIATVVGRLAEFGFAPRHLRSFRSSADREIGLFEQVIAPLMRRGPQDRERAAEMARELAALSLRLHAALVQAGLRGPLGG